ncbi:uncharacterized protein LOC128265457 [Drosophila gunungcola]|uniref:uncharacterized protein LOC128265457 n=1 Tax=Drosophila gunungcola TaxID=103775 RepID=UPI0022E84CB7|nr:uncharacterized protein LOC128265457 [Drosophila gunungcola]
MEKTDKKFVRRQAKELRRNFLEEEDLVEVDASVAAHKCCGNAFNDFDAQSHDAWLLQCPKGTDPHQLAGKRIKMPGRKCVGDLQVRAIKYTALQSRAVGYVTTKGKYALRKLPLTGYVVVGKRLNAKQPAAGYEEQVFPAAATPAKIRFRVRHPFFGHDYKERVQVPEEITKTISEGDKRNLEIKARLWRTANYYAVRSKLLNTTQTLAQKEYDVRQSVVTGLLPNFMKATATPSAYINPTDKVAEEQAAAAVKKSKKQKTNGSVQPDGDELVRSERESAISTKKQKRKQIKWSSPCKRSRKYHGSRGDQGGSY